MVTGTGHKLVQAGHFAAEEVAARVQQLEVALNHLETEAVRRRMLLQQALEVQQALVEVRGCCRMKDSELAGEHWECMELRAASQGRQSFAPCLQHLTFTFSSKVEFPARTLYQNHLEPSPCNYI